METQNLQQNNDLASGELEVKKHPGGRPSDYTQELADTICERLSCGMPLRRVCESEDMPSAATVFSWLRTKQEFLEQYKRAKDEATDAQHEILDDLGDLAIQAAHEVDPKASSAVVQAYKLKADNLKWLMSKMKPKKYGDKVDLTSDGKAIKGNSIIFTDFKNETDN